MNNEILTIIEECPPEIKEQMIKRKYNKNEIIVEQDCNGDYLYILIKGKIQIYIVSEDDVKYLQRIGDAPYIFGEVEVMDSKPSMCCIEALTDCEVLKISREVYRQWLKIDSHFSMFIIQNLCNKLYYKTKKTSKDVFYNLEYRVISLLLDSCRKNNSNYIKLNKSLFAEELATSIRSVNRIFKKLEQQEMIKRDSSKAVICNLERLEEERIRLKK